MNRLPRLSVLIVFLAVTGCDKQPKSEDPARLALLTRTNEQLREKLAKASVDEPLVASALADPGQLALAVRSDVIEGLAGDIARRYLDHVAVDLAEVKGHSAGEVRRKTFLGQIKAGEWKVQVALGKLVGSLRAGQPHITLRAPNLIDLEIPVDVEETKGDASLHFEWDSSGLANVVCKDFELTRTVHGRVLAQHHVLSGSLRLENTGALVRATPMFPNRTIRLRLDLAPQSWTEVERALRSQNTSGTCGALMHPTEGLAFLKAMARRGIDVRLPESIFRAVSLPGDVQESAMVNHRSVGLSVKAESLRVDGHTLWSSASVKVQPSVP